MLTEIQIYTINNFLTCFYPVLRVRNMNRKFKRSIIIDGTTFTLGDATTEERLKTNLINILVKVFNLDYILAKQFIDDFI